MRFGNAAPSSLAFATAAPFAARHGIWKISWPRWEYPVRIQQSDPTFNLKFYPNIQDYTRYPMGTNKVTKSLHHNENLFDLPLDRIRLTILIAIASDNYFSCVLVISASKAAAIAVSAAQVKGQSWRLCSRLLSAIKTIYVIFKLPRSCAQQLRWPITLRLVAQLCWSCGHEISHAET